MEKLAILHASQIATPVGKGARRGAEMREIRLIEDGAVLIRGGKIEAVGKTADLERAHDLSGYTVIDACGKSVIPGFIDSHTHFLFGGYREAEFLARLSGSGYLDIMKAGGGINETVKQTRAQTRDGMFSAGFERLREMLAFGVTTVEGKSGYGLDLDTEIRMLEVMRELNRNQEVSVVPTYLGAHAVPAEYADDPDGYVDFMVNTVLPAVAEKQLAEFCDVFCETGVFSVELSEKLLKRAAGLGFSIKIHADEMTPLGGAELAARMGAVSADHLLNASRDGVRALAETGAVATLLPATAFCLAKPYADARSMIEEGCAVALASDYNPGSCFTGSFPLLLSLACIHMGMTIEEALTAATLNGAAALSRAQRTGSIEPGKDADILILKYPSYQFLVYNTAVNIVDTVIKNGRTVLKR